MKKYFVRLYFHTSVEVEVIAPDKQTAIEYAREKCTGDPQIVENLQDDDFPDVYVWKDQLKDYQAL